MDGYSAMTMLAKQRPEYIPVVKKCVGAHRKEEQKKHQLGFEWDVVGVWPIKLMRLATDYDLLTVTYKSNSATCYMVKDIKGVERALQDIEAGRIAASVEGGMALRVWLSATTVRKLKAYIASEFPEHWDAEGLVVERALNLFLDEATVCSDKEVNMKPVACWHHVGGNRLDYHLSQKRIDLYGPNEFTPTGRNKLSTWWEQRMGLKIGDVIRVVVNGKIVATAVIDSEKPYTLPPAEGKPPWTSAVNLHSIEPVNPPEPADCSGGCQGSHRLDGRTPCAWAGQEVT